MSETGKHSMDDDKQHRSRRIAEKMMKEDAFSRWMGMEILDVREGFCKVSCTITDDMLNGFRVTHGGIIFSLADSALAFSAATYGRVALALDNSISFTQKTSSGNRLTATSECLQITYKTGLFEVKVRNEKDELVAVMKASVYRTSEEFDV
jgi:acyl-CoA thioesterase